MSAKHNALFTKFSSNFSPDIVEKWEMMVNDWEDDLSKKNPFEEAASSAFFFSDLITIYIF
jgi:hypothetical protein